MELSLSTLMIEILTKNWDERSFHLFRKVSIYMLDEEGFILQYLRLAI